MSQGVLNKRIFFLVNPAAGGGRSLDWWQRQLPSLDRLGLDYFWEQSRPQDGGLAQVRAAVLERGAQVVLAVGGDGTAYAAVNGLVEKDRLIAADVIFGLCPAGTACDFCRQAYGADYVGQEDALLHLIRHGQVRSIDLGRCDHVDRQGRAATHYYINSFDAGAGADVCLAVNAEGGRIKRALRNGRLAFLLTALKVLWRFSYTPTLVDTEKGGYNGEYIIIGAANGGYSGGGMQLCPRASLTDGLLDLLLVEKRSRAAIFKCFPLIYRGRHLSQPGVRYMQTREIAIAPAQPMAIELDGEVPGLTPARIRVLPGILPLLLPEDD